MEPRRSPLTSSGPACAASQALRLAPLQCQSIWLLIRMFLPVLFPHPAVVQATGCPSRAPLARWFRLPPRHAGRLDLPCWRRPVMLPRQTPFGRRQCCSRHFSSILQLTTWRAGTQFGYSHTRQPLSALGQRRCLNCCHLYRCGRDPVSRSHRLIGLTVIFPFPLRAVMLRLS